MTDEPTEHRVISRDLSPDHRIIAVVATGGEADDKTDDEILDGLQQWRKQRHLRAVDE
ncbi:hypothetical protein ACH40F_08015 [Streptomyces sp. NPDC020794]|uniref:hypothetical protein n=1 Tax=unclassified Streptomyces TaxID=2593676 RepID=UPI0036ED1AFB